MAMKNAPSNAEMMNPTNAQSGKPSYVDSSVESPQNRFYPNRGNDVPAYVVNNPRYWEYR